MSKLLTYMMSSGGLLGILSSLGLHEKEACVYLTLLKSGRCSISELSAHAQIKRPTVYLALDALERRGLVGATRVGKRRQYTAVNPRRLREIAQIRLKLIEESLPELTALQNTPKARPRMMLIEGREGVRSLYAELYESLKKNSEALWITRIDALKSTLPGALEDYKKMLKRLDKPRVRELNYGNAAGREWFREIRPLLRHNPFHQVRLIPEEFEVGFTDALIYEARTNLFTFRGSICVTVIEHEEIAAMFRALFNFAWAKAIVPKL